MLQYGGIGLFKLTFYYFLDTYLKSEKTNFHRNLEGNFRTTEN